MRISCSTTSQKCSIGLRSGDCGGHLSKVNSLSCSRNQSWDDLRFVTWCIILLEEAIRRWYTVVIKGWTWTFLQWCHMKRHNKIFTKMWGVYSLLWDTFYIYILGLYLSNILVIEYSTETSIDESDNYFFFLNSNPKYTRENKTSLLKWTSNLFPF